MLKNGTCDWVSTFHYCVASWTPNLWSMTAFYKDIHLLSNGSIENLEFENCPEKDLNFIKDFTNLKKLSLTNSKTVDITLLKPEYDGTGKCISGFPNLEELTIQNSVTDITSVGKLTKLKRLDVSGNKINNGIEELSKLKQLEYVNLKNCSSLSSVNRYVNVVTKEPSDDFINIFKNLHISEKLNELDLSGTGIKNIKAKLQSDEETWKTLNCDS